MCVFLSPSAGGLSSSVGCGAGWVSLWEYRETVKPAVILLLLLLLLLSRVSRGPTIGGGIESERWMLGSQVFYFFFFCFSMINP